MNIEPNVTQVMERIAAAARRAGRDPAEVTLVAVAKTFPAEAVVEAHRAGVSVFGENKVQEARPKIAAVTAVLGKSVISWHMVGHLQRNKAKRAVRLFDCLHSVDSIRLAEELEKRCAALETESGKKRRVPVRPACRRQAATGCRRRGNSELAPPRVARADDHGAHRG